MVCAPFIREILREEYLNPLEMSVNALSKALHVPATRMNELSGKTGESPRIRRSGLLATSAPVIAFIVTILKRRINKAPIRATRKDGNSYCAQASIFSMWP